MRSVSFVKSPQRVVFSSTIRVADGVGCHALLQGIFPTQGSNPGLLHCRQILYHLSHQVSPRILEWVAYPSAGDLPNPGIEPGSPALQANSLLIQSKEEMIDKKVCLVSTERRVLCHNDALISFNYSILAKFSFCIRETSFCLNYGCLWLLLLFSRVWLFATPWTGACQASLSSRACSNSCPLNW